MITLPSLNTEAIILLIARMYFGEASQLVASKITSEDEYCSLIFGAYSKTSLPRSVPTQEVLPLIKNSLNFFKP